MVWALTEGQEIIQGYSLLGTDGHTAHSKNALQILVNPKAHHNIVSHLIAGNITI